MEPRRSGRIMVFLVLVICGLLMAASTLTSRGTQLRGEAATLADLAREQTAGGQELEDEVGSLRRQTEELADAVSEGDVSAESARRLAESRAGAAGLEAVTGAGVTVALDDALPPGGAEDSDANDLIVHQQDVQAVVNALWAGGARALAINDQRLISTSAVRCVGNTLRINSRVYSPPYTISAVGDPDALGRSLAESEEVAVYLSYVDRLGLGWSQSTEDELTLPAYSGSLDIRYAQAK